ncbi:MAG: DEAD/DEAH box helicase, partial [Rubrobacteridae bacterium]|nr:DEAD/DEAH box helicase [Rubrobacteridae bacterium]
MEEFASFLEHLKNHPEYRGQIDHKRILIANEAQCTLPSYEIPQDLQDRLKKAGIESIYSHQAKAYDLAKAGNNVLAVSGTASGKSLSYNLPVFDSLLTNKKAKALYLFPTKALAQDQLRSLRDFE